jgi:shikimate dehydrogenase
MLKKSTVIGYPIAHSLSPKLHNYWLKKYNIEGSYDKTEIKPEELKTFIKNAQKQGLSGFNITIPHKEKAFEIISQIGEVSEIAQKISAINTVYFADEKIKATNSDAYGFIASLAPHISDFANKNILLIGAGGAAKAICFGLVEEGAKNIIIANRSIEKAKALLPTAKTIKLDEIGGNSANIDILINATSLGMEGQEELKIDLESLPKTAVVADIVYKPRYTKLLKNAQERGNPIVEGIDMLIHQAAVGFELWFGIRPEVTGEERELLLG